MKNSILILFFTVIIFCGKSFSQDMTPPPPIQSEFMEASVGTWVSEPYEMMGQQMTDEVTQTMVLNGQFMEIDVTSSSNGAVKYKGKGLFTVNPDGSLNGWFFDIYGKDGVAVYTGNVSGKNATFTGSSAFMNEKRVMTVDGDKMYHEVTFGIKSPGESDPSEIKLNIVFNKKN